MAVIGFALGVGAIVFAISLFGGDETLALHPGREPPGPSGGGLPGFGSDEREEGEDRSGDDFVYVPVTPESITWRTRLTGVVGLVLLVGLGAFAVAFGVYQAGHLINRTIAKFLGQ
jgi:hypothetical protein